MMASCFASVSVNPTSVTDGYWVWVDTPPTITHSQSTLGKWLVFKHFDKLDETWHSIRKVVESGELGATGAKCSTARENPNSRHQDKGKTGVICVYTSEESVDEVGLKLVNIVKQDIRYKTDEATLKGLYTSKGHGRVSLKTIYWNDGDPGFEKKKKDKGSSVQHHH